MEGRAEIHFGASMNLFWSHIYINLKTSQRMCSVKIDIEHVICNMVFLCILYAQKGYTINTLGLQEKKFRNPPYHRGFLQYLSIFLWLLSPRRPWKF